MNWQAIALLSIGAVVPLVIGSIYAIVKRFVSRRVDFHGPDSERLERIEGAVMAIRHSQDLSAKAIQKVDLEIGSIIPAVKITVKKVRHDLGRLEEGEEFNGDLAEAWSEIKAAEEIHRGARNIRLGECEG